MPNQLRNAFFSFHLSGPSDANFLTTSRYSNQWRFFDIKFILISGSMQIFSNFRMHCTKIRFLVSKFSIHFKTRISWVAYQSAKLNYKIHLMLIFNHSFIFSHISSNNKYHYNNQAKLPIIYQTPITTILEPVNYFEWKPEYQIRNEKQMYSRRIQ